MADLLRQANRFDVSNRVGHILRCDCGSAMGDYDESDATAEEFDAMWASATPVDTLAHIAVNAPGQSFWLSGSGELISYRAAGHRERGKSGGDGESHL